MTRRLLSGPGTSGTLRLRKRNWRPSPVRWTPAHPDTASVIAQVAASIELRSEHRILTPDRDTWREAGILAGLLARLQRYGKTEQRTVLNDALIFLTATKNGCVVLTRNVTDFDLLMQLDAKGQAVFYDSL
jgi:hypothetical protein